jgi:cytochrome P450
MSPKAADKWEPFVRAAVTACLNAVIEKGSCDLVLDLANPIPAMLTCEFLGLPVADWRTFAEPMHESVYVPQDSPDYVEVMHKIEAMMGKVAETVATRRVEPKDDLITRLVQGEVNGEPLSDDVIMEMLMLVLVGGVDTTTALMANTFLWLSEHPEERQRLIDHPELRASAREEMLRYFTPVQILARTVTADTKLGDAELTLGDRIAMSFAGANRDPEAFECPEKLDIERSPNRHVSFGLGVHRCVGSNIARLEIDVMLDEVLRRMPDFVVQESEGTRYTTIGVVNGWVTLPATFTPGAVEQTDFVL